MRRICLTVHPTLESIWAPRKAKCQLQQFCQAAIQKFMMPLIVQSLSAHYRIGTVRPRGAQKGKERERERERVLSWSMQEKV